jgi:hypothetical protein
VATPMVLSLRREGGCAEDRGGRCRLVEISWQLRGFVVLVFLKLVNQIL